MFTFYLTVSFFVDGVCKEGWKPGAQAVMRQVCEFYIVNGILDFSGSFLQVNTQLFGM